MASTRAYILAKELGVKSSAIIEKCKSEGIDLPNHMAVISAGLAATIREWFSEDGATNTAVETANKVDLEKVRVKRKRVKKDVDEKPAAQALTEAGEAVAETTEQTITAQPDQIEQNLQVAPESILQEQPVTVEPSEVIEPQKEPQPKPEPKPVLPAGPMLGKPEPARLTGPSIVRVEAPEPMAPLRQRTKHKPRHDSPLTEPLMKVKTAPAT
ncbi:MAG: hypothetical protein E4H40_04545, partial [Candidatus Brocadiia bacterium]